MDKMKKYFTMLLLLTILLMPIQTHALQSNNVYQMVYPRDDNDMIDDDTDTTRDNLDDNNDNNNNNRNNNRNNGILDNDVNDNNNNNRNNNGMNAITGDLDNDLDDNDSFTTYLIIGLSGIVLGAFGTYLFVKRD